MTNVHPFPSKLPTAAPQQSGNVTTLQRALRDGVTPETLRAVAKWNDKQCNVWRRERPRLRAQRDALDALAVELKLERRDLVRAA